jgi:hypothetical protein
MCARAFELCVQSRALIVRGRKCLSRGGRCLSMHPREHTASSRRAGCWHARTHARTQTGTWEDTESRQRTQDGQPHKKAPPLLLLAPALVPTPSAGHGSVTAARGSMGGRCSSSLSSCSFSSPAVGVGVRASAPLPVCG